MNTPNLYEPPGADSNPDASGDGPDAVRRRTMGHEVTSVGFGKLIAAIGWCILGLSSLLSLLPTPDLPGPKFRDFALILVLYGVLLISVGVLVWTRSPAARRWAFLVGLPHLFAFPVGTLAGALLLWIVYGEAGRTVFSEQHVALRRVTPGLRLPGSAFGWLAFLVGLLSLPVFALLGLMVLAARMAPQLTP